MKSKGKNYMGELVYFTCLSNGEISFSIAHDRVWPMTSYALPFTGQNENLMPPMEPVACS